MSDERLRKLYKKSVDSEPVNMDLKAQLMAMAKQVKEAEENGGSAEDVLGPDTDNTINTPIVETEVFAASIAKRKRVRNTIMSITALAACLTLCVVAAPKLSEYMNRNNGGDDGVISTVTSDGTPAPELPGIAAATAVPEGQGIQNSIIPPLPGAAAQSGSTPQTTPGTGAQSGNTPQTEPSVGAPSGRTAQAAPSAGAQSGRTPQAAPSAGAQSTVPQSGQNSGTQSTPAIIPSAGITGGGAARPSADATAPQTNSGAQNNAGNTTPQTPAATAAPLLPSKGEDEVNTTPNDKNGRLNRKLEECMTAAKITLRGFVEKLTTEIYDMAPEELQTPYKKAVTDYSNKYKEIKENSDTLDNESEIVGRIKDYQRYLWNEEDSINFGDIADPADNKGEYTKECNEKWSSILEADVSDEADKSAEKDSDRRAESSFDDSGRESEENKTAEDEAHYESVRGDDDMDTTGNNNIEQEEKNEKSQE